MKKRYHRKGSRRSKISYSIPKRLIFHLFAVIVVGSLLAWIIYTIPPNSISTIFIACLLLSLTTFILLKLFFDIEKIVLPIVGVGIAFFLYLSNLLDIINAVILIGFLLSFGLFIRQK